MESWNTQIEKLTGIQREEADRAASLASCFRQICARSSMSCAGETAFTTFTSLSEVRSLTPRLTMGTRGNDRRVRESIVNIAIAPLVSKEHAADRAVDHFRRRDGSR